MYFKMTKLDDQRKIVFAVESRENGKSCCSSLLQNFVNGFQRCCRDTILPNQNTNTALLHSYLEICKFAGAVLIF